MSKIILEPIQAAANSLDFTVRENDPNSGAHHVTAPGLAGAEVATVEKLEFDGQYYVYSVDGVQQDISATNSGIVVTGVGVYRVAKAETIALVGVGVSTNGSP